MSAAAAQSLQQIPTGLIADIASREYGLSAEGYVVPQPVVEAEPIVEAAPVAEPEPIVEPEPIAEPELAAEPEPIVEPEPIAEPELAADPEPVDPEPVTEHPAEAEQKAEPNDEPVLVFADDAGSHEEAESPEEAEPAIPELIQDTLPDLEVLAPNLASSESTANDVSDWDRDPTFAELKPDIEALEQAMAVTQDVPEPEPPVLEPVTVANAEPAPTPQPAIDEPEEIPEITLDNAINEQIQSCQTSDAGEVNTDVEAASVNPGKKGKKADAEIEKIAAELAKAKSIEDVDDKMAETLFGEEISIIAAQVIANPPPDISANEELGEIETEEQAAASGGSSIALELAPEPQETAVEVTLEAEEETGMDLSASQRLKTVRALNADLHPSLRDSTDVATNEVVTPAETPDSIEDQIDTSMTETFKALNISPPISSEDVDEDDEDEQKGGFFSRFKRS